MDAEPGGLAARLRSAIWPLHQRAQHTTLQTMLAMGVLPREYYGRYVIQMLHVHRALEIQIDVAKTAHAVLDRVCRPHQRRADDLHADLTWLGVDPAPCEPLPATTQLIRCIDHCARNEPLGLLGCLYVVEGSLNGRKHAARAMRRALGCPDERGVRALDPYGDQQMERWLEFRADLDATELTADEEERITRGAMFMFEGVIAICDAICPPPPQMSGDESADP
jgi:heme oxygenase